MHAQRSLLSVKCSFSRFSKPRSQIEYNLCYNCAPSPKTHRGPRSPRFFYAQNPVGAFSADPYIERPTRILGAGTGNNGYLAPGSPEFSNHTHPTLSHAITKTVKAPCLLFQKFPDFIGPIRFWTPNSVMIFHLAEKPTEDPKLLGIFLPEIRRTQSAQVFR